MQLIKVIIVLFVTVGNRSQAQDLGTAVVDIILPALSKMFGGRCSKNVNPNALEDLLSSARNIGLCTSSKSPLPNEETDIIDHVCKSYRYIEYDCLQNFTNKVQSCLGTQETFTRDFILKARVANFNYICKNKGNGLRNLSSYEVANCQIKQVDVLSKCLQKSKLVDDFSKVDSVLTKVELCSDVKELVSCLSDGTKQQCQSSPKVAEYLSLAYNTYIEPCNVI